MVAWIIYYRKQAEYNRQYIDLYKTEGVRLGILIKLILVEELEFGVQDNQWFLKYEKQQVEYPDFAINRAIYPLLSRQLELMGIKVFNNSFVADVCNDKAKTYQYLAGTGIPMVSSGFYRNSQLDELLTRTEQPSVIKAVDGHGGNQVFLIDRIKGSPIDEIKKAMGASDVVLQPLTGSRHQDLRVYVIGKEIIAAVLRTAKEGFRANYSLGGEVCLYRLSDTERSFVETIIERFDFGLAGIDFIIGDEGELIFNEIEDVVGARMLYQCSDINIAGLYLNHILEIMGTGK